MFEILDFNHKKTAVVESEQMPQVATVHSGDAGSSSITTDTQMSPIEQQKFEDFKRLAQHAMQITNINVMENSITPRYESILRLLIYLQHFIELNHFFFFSEMRYDSLCKQIITDMNLYGMCVVDDFLGGTYGLDILKEGKHSNAKAIFSDFMEIFYDVLFSSFFSSWPLWSWIIQGKKSQTILILYLFFLNPISVLLFRMVKLYPIQIPM